MPKTASPKLNFKKSSQILKIKAAKNLAAVIKNPTKNLIIPSVFSKEVVKAVARAIR